MTEDPFYEKCHGCHGRGWVIVEGKPHRCPVCYGKGKIRKEMKTIW